MQDAGLKGTPQLFSFATRHKTVQNLLYHHFTTVDSTNTIAVDMAGQGAGHGTIIHADCQTGGRGRGGREFFSPVGGLYFSLILRPEVEIRDLPLITLAAGVGLCTGIRKAINVDVQLKWPNDLYLNGQKLAGILTESGPVRKGGQAEFIVIGIGINTKTEAERFPVALRKKIISLSEVTNTAVDSDTLLQSLAAAVFSAIQRLSRDKNGLLIDWRHFDYLLGRQLNYVGHDKMVSATGAGLADDGRYVIVDQQGVRHHVLAGDLNPISLIPELSD